MTHETIQEILPELKHVEISGTRLDDFLFAIDVNNPDIVWRLRSTLSSTFLTMGTIQWDHGEIPLINKTRSGWTRELLLFSWPQLAQEQLYAHAAEEVKP